MNNQELIKCSSEGNEFGVLTAILDGKEIKNLEQYRTQTVFIILQWWKGTYFIYLQEHSKAMLMVSLFS